MLVLNGGIVTFNTIYEAVTSSDKGFRVVLIKGSGQVADLFTDWIQKENLDKIITDPMTIEALNTDIAEVLGLETEEQHEFCDKMIKCLKNKSLVSLHLVFTFTIQHEKF